MHKTLHEITYTKMVYLLIHYLNNHPYDNKQIRQEYKQSSL